MIARIASVVVALFITAAPAAAQAPIRDNSFLVEEAYNQPWGVVQHVTTFFTVRRLRGWEASFTQEWPAPSERHQLSYTVPVYRSGDAGALRTGIGDIALNYRYQVPMGDASTAALAPRLSVVVPTGNEDRGFGGGGAGVEVNLPLSVELAPWLVSHSNVGGSWTPKALNVTGDDASSTSYTIGQSIIVLLHSKLNAMLEARWSGEQQVTGPDMTEWEREVLLAPGLRGAIDFRSGLQVVPGIAVPFGLGPSDGLRGVFVYLSFEHPFRRR